MPAPLSIVIPSLNAEAELREMLPCVVEGVASGLVREVIVSDGGSSDETCALARATGAEVIEGTPGRGGQLARGCAVARGDWLLVLHADSRLPGGWANVVQAAMADVGHAHAFRLAFRASGGTPRLVAGWANLRSRIFGLPYGDQGLLVSQQMYAAAGRYPDIPLMEDVALVRALPGRVRLLPMAVSTSADRYEADGWWRRGGRNLWTLLRYLAGASPETLARSYAAGSEARSSGSLN